MPYNGLHEIQLILVLLLLFVSLFAALARRLEIPYPIILVIAGLGLGFVPGIPRIEFDPDIIFLLVLPPLLYSAALGTSWRAFSRNLISVGMMAVGAVGVTVAGVATVSPWLFSGFDWRIGAVLGATVATNDAIAATSIANRLGLSRKIVELLEGEGLVNDASGLLALEFAIAILDAGRHPSFGSGLLRFAWLSGAAIGAGFAVARIAEWLERRIDDGPIEIALNMFVPYAAWLAAETIDASGVLCVVTAGLYLGQKSSELMSSATRIQRRAFQDALTFVLNGIVFVLIGLQLPAVLHGVREHSIPKLLIYGASLSLLLIVIRLIWTFAGASLAHWIHIRLLRQPEDSLNPRQMFLVGWTGMRGVIALAAAMSLPVTTSDGSPFPDRDLIIFLTFSVIFVTLVLQGLSLPLLIRGMGLARTGRKESLEHRARRLVIESGLDRLRELRAAGEDGFEEVYDALARHYEYRLASIPMESPKGAEPGARYARHIVISRTLVEAEHKTTLRLRDEGRISDELMREMEHEMDLEIQRLDAATDRMSDAGA